MLLKTNKINTNSRFFSIKADKSNVKTLKSRFFFINFAYFFKK